MKELKRLLFRCFFALEIVTFLYLYAFGSQGLPAWFALKRETSILEQEIMHLHDEVTALKDEVDLYQNFALPKEKIAREQLQMARPDDHIFYFK